MESLKRVVVDQLLKTSTTDNTGGRVNSSFHHQGLLERHKVQQSPHLRSFAAFLAFMFAIHEVNRNPELLPNITLGYHMFDAFGDEMKSLQSFLQVLSGRYYEVPNYSCIRDEEVVGFMGYSFTMEQILEIYGYTKINYDMMDRRLNSNVDIKSLFTMAPRNHVHHLAIVLCLKHFEWNFVGILIPEDDSAEAEVRELSRTMARYGICIEYVVKLFNDLSKNVKTHFIIQRSRAEVLIICGQFTTMYHRLLHVFDQKKTLILNDSWLMHLELGPTYVKIVNCSLSFSASSNSLPKLWRTIKKLNLMNSPKDQYLVSIAYFFCLNYNEEKKIGKLNVLMRNCSKNYFPTADIHADDIVVYYVYTAVFVLAHAIHDMNLFMEKYPFESRRGNYRKKLKYFIRRVNFIDYSSKHIAFDETRKLRSEGLFLLKNWQFQSNKRVTYISLANSYFLPNNKTPENDWFHVHTNSFAWKSGSHRQLLSDDPKDKSLREPVQETLVGTQLAHDDQSTFQDTVHTPKSRCNEKCPPGSRKAPNGGYHSCCYDCAPCSESEVTNITDSEICEKCPMDEWPNLEKTECIPKLYVYLSYKDEIAAFFCFSVILCCAMTCYTLRKFILFWDTPLVKANNRTLSFILLVSILLSFLCIFLFLGRPLDITCMLRQTLFGIFFTLAISSLLAKSIIVCIAFKATKPSSSWRKFTGVLFPNLIVLVCSLFQLLICVCWLVICPPYQEFNMSTYPGTIIIQCNEGSDIWFYSMLGYLGLLAAVSFFLAFMVRKLPDSFNEAKYITFSMLVFCSVWIAMIPAYLSTRGKYMVALEIFAILTSCAGILSCIFFPKLYILLVNPEINIRKQVLSRLGKT
ncbi:vomeronasal type-2 receptor 26-like [Anomaloglossus baeobatrachus]|uniref:vomeronasal type-2 receptor 26-like n=1 Tax=Anomaloglossus baeobatrachus TaxID=238106 RepID=UPI003F4F71F1